MDEVDGFTAEPSSAQAYEIEPAITGRLFARNDIWRDIHAEAAAALYHHVSSDAAELMAKNSGADNGVVVDDYLSGKFCGIADDEIWQMVSSPLNFKSWGLAEMLAPV